MLTLTVLLQVTAAAALGKLGAGIGAGIAAIAAGIGIRSNMIVSAALIEGVAFFAVVVCMLILFF